MISNFSKYICNYFVKKKKVNNHYIGDDKYLFCCKYLYQYFNFFILNYTILYKLAYHYILISLLSLLCDRSSNIADY